MKRTAEISPRTSEYRKSIAEKLQSCQLQAGQQKPNPIPPSANPNQQGTRPAAPATPPPAQQAGIGFLEDFFEQKAKAVATFWRVVNQRLATPSEVA